MSDDFKKSDEEREASGASNSENPYQSPMQKSLTPPGRPAGRIVAAWIIGLLAVPATIIVFLTTCFMTGLVMFDVSQGEDAAIIIAFIVGIVCAAMTIWMFVKLTRATMGRSSDLTDWQERQQQNHQRKVEPGAVPPKSAEVEDENSSND